MFETWYSKLLVVAILLILIFLWWIGLFRSMKIRESQFSGGTMIYIDWQGPLKNIRQPFDKAANDLEKYRKAVESMG